MLSKALDYKWLSAFYPFPMMFFKVVFLKDVKGRDSMVWYQVNPLPDDKTLEWTKLKQLQTF